MITNLIFLSCFISLILLIWFKSDAFIEYAKLFKFNKFIKLDDYHNEIFSNPNLNYPLFLKTREWKNRYISFFFKIIGCRLCLNVWLSSLCALFLCYSIISWVGYTSVLSIVSLFIYGHISKLLNENK